jgi:hypothetical protein
MVFGQRGLVDERMDDVDLDDAIAALRRARTQSLLPAVGYAGVVIMLMVTSPDLLSFLVPFVAVLTGSGYFWIQRLSDRQDAARQAAHPDGFATQAAWFHAGRLDKGELCISDRVLSWSPSPSSKAQPFATPIASDGVVVIRRGRLQPRASVIAMTNDRTLLFTTTARYQRALDAVAQMNAAG